MKGAGRGSLCFALKQQTGHSATKKIKGGENSFVLTSRGGGVLLDNPLGGSAGPPCQAGLRPHSRLFIQFVRRLTTKELVFVGFVALQNARVNDKKVNESMRKNAPSPISFRFAGGSSSTANSLCRRGSLASRPRELRVAQEKCR